MIDTKNTPNIGPILAQKLDEADIHTIEELRLIGSEQAFLRLCALDNNTCINTLFALEGAIRNIRWHQLDKNRREELHVFFKQAK